MLLKICSDVAIKISEYLSDREKLRLAMTCIMMDKLKYKFTYCEKVNIHAISELSYFDNFESIEIFSNNIRPYPKCVKHIYFEADSDIIPQLVTRLNFSSRF